MCDRCDEIERELEKYRAYRSAANEPLAIGLLQLVIEDLRSEREALHADEVT